MISDTISDTISDIGCERRQPCIHGVAYRNAPASTAASATATAAARAPSTTMGTNAAAITAAHATCPDARSAAGLATVPAAGSTAVIDCFLGNWDSVRVEVQITFENVHYSLT